MNQATYLEEFSPLGNVKAIVEGDGRSVYFYLFFAPASQFDEQHVQACWIRNLKPSPRGFEKSRMDRGEAPMMPAEYCADPQPLPAPHPENLSIIWFEEGNGAALYEHGELLAVIPSWAGVDGFPGYTRDVIRDSPFGWPLPLGDAMTSRLQRAHAFWQSWDSDEEFWPRYRDQLIQHWETILQATHSNYYAIDGDEWPPRAMIRFNLDDYTLLTTIGMSLLPMPNVEMITDDPAVFRRVELGFAIDPACPEDELLALSSYLSGQSSLPWNHFTWLGQGHTIPCDATPAFAGGSEFPFVILSATLPASPKITLPTFRGDAVTHYWLLPITAAERDLAEKVGSAQLLDELERNEVDFIIRPREPVIDTPDSSA